MLELTVGQFMTCSLHTIEADLTLADARTKMQRHRLQYLPVVERGKLIGLISDRDLRAIFAIKDFNAHQVRVGDVASREIFTAEASMRINTVAAEMADGKCDAVIVIEPESERVIGVFTTAHALGALSMLWDGGLSQSAQ